MSIQEMLTDSSKVYVRNISANEYKILMLLWMLQRNHTKCIMK